MTDPGPFVDSIRAYLDGRSPAVEFGVDFNDLYDTTTGADPVELWSAFEELATVAFRYLNECESLDWEGDVDDGHLRAAAQKTYDIASDIIRRRGLGNIR